MKGKTNPIWYIAGIVVVLAALGYIPYQDYLPQTQSVTGGISGQTGTGQQGTLEKAFACGGGDALPDLELTLENVRSTSSNDFPGGTVTTVRDSDNKPVASTTVVSGVTPTADTDELDCGQSYHAVIVNSATFAAARTASKTTGVDGVGKLEFDVKTANASDISFNLFYTGNRTNFTASPGVDITSQGAVLASGGSFKFVVEISSNSSSAQWGAMEDLKETRSGAVGPAFICANFPLAKFGKDDVQLTIPGLIRGESAQLPDFCVANGYEKAWVINPIRSGQVFEGVGSITASGGNPGSTDDVRFYVVDNNFYSGSDGNIKIGSADDSSTDTGKTNRYWEIATI